ncbi:hypothetical protein [Pseudomonas peli]|uniref:hypothetical protein n=1 Tax=Pseudomonas peli TaxID=592361 RepID=UPI0024ADBC9C|nr:hypothetical protein [Pseudomonas peli]
MNRIQLSSLTIGVLMTSLGASVHAANATTNTVKGRAPVVTNVTVLNRTNPGIGVRVGNVVTAGYRFNDADGDAESGTTFRWRRNGKWISGATSSTYTVVTADANNYLEVEVAPKTSPLTTEPAIGTAITSDYIAVVAAGAPVGIGNFLAPDAAIRTWADANNYCSELGGGARLPTRRELERLFLDATSATALGQNNREMCNTYGWPLNVSCGGSRYYYWSSTPGDAVVLGEHYGVDLSNGGANNFGDRATNHVSCVR